MRLTKRVLSVILTLCMMLSVLPATALLSRAAEGVSVAVSSVTAAAGDTVTVDIVMDSGANKVNGWQFSLGYDTSVLTYKKADHCPDMSVNPYAFNSTEEARYGHPLTIGCTFNGETVSGKNVIARITFAVSETAADGNYSVTIEECKTGGNTFYLMESTTSKTEYTPSYQNGSVAIGDGVTLEASADKETVAAGDTVVVTYTLQNPSSLPIAGYEFHLDYDSSVFTLAELTVPASIDGKEAIGVTGLASGLVANTLRDTSTFSAASVTVATATFTVKAGIAAGEYEISADVSSPEDTVYGPLPEMKDYAVSASACTVTVDNGELPPVPEGFTLEATASKTEVAAGEEFTVEFKLVDLPDTGVAGWDFKLLYDSKVLEIVKYEDVKIGSLTVLGGISESGNVFGVIPGADGTGVTNQKEDAVIAKVTFRALETATAGATSEIGAEFNELFYTILTAPYERDIAFPKVAPATVKVTDGAAAGLLGDVNSDGQVNAADRTVLARYLAKWDNITIDLSVADLNEDGQVNAADRTILARYLAKWNGYESLPVK